MNMRPPETKALVAKRREKLKNMSQEELYGPIRTVKPFIFKDRNKLIDWSVEPKSKNTYLDAV